MSIRKSEELGVIYLAKHGETAWSRTGQHTGLTDLPMTEQGERNARRLGERLKELTFAKVFTSPLRRATRTCELAGFGSVAEMDPHLVEWDYGEYEGRATAEIRAERPNRRRRIYENQNERCRVAPLFPVQVGNPNHEPCHQ